MGDELPHHFSASIFIFSSDLAFEIWSVSTARPPATQEAHKHPSKQHTRCSAVSPAAQTDEKTADTSLTTSPGWDTFQPPELNQAPVEAAFGYFISYPSPYSLEVRLIYLTRMSVDRILNLTSHSLWLSTWQLLVSVLFNMVERLSKQQIQGPSDQIRFEPLYPQAASGTGVLVSFLHSS